MEKKTPQGKTKVPNGKSTQNRQNNKKESKESFEINRKEFPSLNEILDQSVNKKSTSDINPFSYSERVKKVPMTSKSSKFETGCDASRSSFSAYEETAIKLSRNKESHDLQSCPADSSSEAASSSKQFNPGRIKLEEKLSNERKVPTLKFPCKRDCIKSEVSSSKSGSNKKENLPQKERTSFLHPSSSTTESKSYRQEMNTRPYSHKVKSNASTSGTQTVVHHEKNSSKPLLKNEAVSEQELKPGVVKKKKRKSKVKRQAALQTGKILVLTPELHSKILNQTNMSVPKQNQNTLTNINDCEEYPELGSSVKSNKENTVKCNEHVSKNYQSLENEQEANTLSELVSTSSNNSEALKNDGEAISKSLESEKSPVLLKDPITVSLFDMLQNVKYKKKDTEKKGDIVNQDSRFGNVSLPKVLGKKGVPNVINPLDSSRPTIKRGKEREKPKVKKPSRMRKLILIGRQLRKEELGNSENIKNSETAFGNISNECHSTAKSSHSVESILNQKSESDPENISFSEDEKLEIKQNILLSEKSLQLKDENYSDEINSKSSGESESGNDSAIDSHFEYDDNSVNNVTSLKELKQNGTNQVDVHSSNYSSNDLALNSIRHLKCETIKSVSGVINDKSRNVRDTEMGIILNEQTQSSNDSVLCVEVDSLSQLVNNNIDFLSNLFRSDESFSDSTLKQIIPISTQEDDKIFKESSSQEMSCDKSHLTESSSDKLMKLMKSITSKPDITDELRTEAVKTLIHSRKFRKYCNHFISKELDEVVFALLDDLARFQDRMHQKDPVKARIRKRLLYGIKEIKRHMKLKKLKAIILATDIEDIKTEGGLNDVINDIISLAEAYHIPYIFSHRRFNLGKVCRKGVPVSCVGIFYYEGSEKNFKKILELQEESKMDYLTVTYALSQVLSCDEVTEILQLGKGAPDKLQEVRTTILKEHFKLGPDQNIQASFNMLKDSNQDQQTNENSNLLHEINGSASMQIDKNSVYHILIKHNFV